MCTSIFFADNARHVATVRDLASELGVAPVNLVWGDNEPSVEDEYDFKYCLCPIDIEATLKHCGYSGAWSATGDPMCFVAKRNELSRCGTDPISDQVELS